MIKLIIVAIFSLIASLLVDSSLVSIITFLVMFYVYISHAKRFSWRLNRDGIFLIAGGIFLVVCMYDLLFLVADAKEYLTLNEAQRHHTVTFGIIVAESMLLGAGCAIRRNHSYKKNDFIASRKLFDVLVLFAWAPLLINLVSYLIFFSGRSYVDVHTSSGTLGNVLIKTIYVTYGATIILGHYFSNNDALKKNLLYLLLGNLFIFAVLYQLRSPFFFYFLLVFFFVGHKINKKVLYLTSLVAPIFLASVAVWRDPTLLHSGTVYAIANLFVTLGDFADTIPFTIAKVNADLPSFGLDILGSFLGVTEPLANEYAKNISEEYFYNGGGFGFFLPADLIANFGVLGAPIAALLFSYGLTKIASKTHSLGKTALAASVFASSFAFVRNDIGSTFRGCVYTVVAMFFLRLFVELFIVPKKKSYYKEILQ